MRVALEAIDALTDAKARLRDKLNARKAEEFRKVQEEKAKLEVEHQKQVLRLAMLEKLATTEVVVERHSRWLSLVPFGVGQFQNGQTAEGWLFLTAEGLFAAGPSSPQASRTATRSRRGSTISRATRPRRAPTRARHTRRPSRTTCSPEGSC